MALLTHLNEYWLHRQLNSKHFFAKNRLCWFFKTQRIILTGVNKSCSIVQRKKYTGYTIKYLSV